MKEKYDIWIKEFMESWKQLDWKRTLETLDKNVKYYENPIDEPCKDDTKEIILTMWANEIDYKGLKVNVIRQIKKNKQTGENSIWMWITNREVTRRNVEKIIYCAKCRDYIEGFREQKVTSGIDLEHVYSKNIRAIKMIYTIIQITHLILQIIEHSDICGEFNKKYGSVKVFRRKFYAHLTETLLNIELIQIKIQIRFDKSTLI